MIASLFLAASFALQHAEFAKYHRAITGREPGADVVTFAVDPAVSKSGRDAYAIKSEGTGVRIVGSNERSVWYGLYDLLERRGGCHWFWDGDVVPKRDAIDLSGLDVTEEAQFEYRGMRYFAHRGLTRFQAEHWGPADWKREIDWCLKRRLNVFMLRIGQDDLFQRTFPDVCAYPDASKDLPGHGKGYDNRTLFWSLQYRGKLRQDVQRYGFERGMIVPEDFGTMSHWYSRTPEDYLEKMKPDFLPQANNNYSERNGLVWDIRQDKWADEYWKMTQTAVREYGQPGPGLLHTIGLGERLCYTNRADNLKLKIDALHTFLRRAHRDYPERKVMIGGWDFMLKWYPDEVKALVKTLDPERDIIWDYEGDTTRDYLKIGGNDFTKWGLVGQFPYTYSIFLALDSALDVRANYKVIEERQKIVQDDPMCKGYVLWPEACHTDTLCLRYFTENAWRKGGVKMTDVLDEFCAARYGADAARWQPLWKQVTDLAPLLDWGDNYIKYTIKHERYEDPAWCPDGSYNTPAYWEAKAFPEQLRPAPAILRALARLDWKKSVFAERDAIDLARTTADRFIITAYGEMLKAYHGWKQGKLPAETAVRKAKAVEDLARLMADLLALHTDYSIAESYDRLDAVEKIANPNFKNVLVENAVCDYCVSHQYEAARYWAEPELVRFADDLVRRMTTDDRSDIGKHPRLKTYLASLLGKRTLDEMRPTLPRTQENYEKTLNALADAADVFAK